MNRLVTMTALAALMAGSAAADEVKIGVLLGFTGGAETLAPDMAAGAELAMTEASESGLFLGGSKAVPVRADSTCGDAALATAAAERLVTAERVNGIVGAICSGASGAVLQNVSVPNGMVQISPSSTSPGLSTMEDDGFFFRTAPSDARQGQVIAEMLQEMGISSAALTYTNNDYGKGLADSIEANFTALGGTITLNAAHEDDKADYSAEIGALASAGGETLIVAGYADRGGQGIVRAALDSGAFDSFILPDAMVSPAIEEAFGDEIEGSVGVVPGSDSPGAALYLEVADGFEPATPYSAESYDAAALILLAMQAAGSSDPSAYKEKVMMVANAPGEKIYPGELAKGLQILADGGEVDFEGATAITFVDPGEHAGSYRQIEISGGAISTVGFR